MMEEYPGVIWGGSFDEDLHQLITVFASADLPNEAGLPGPYARSLFFDEHTVENLCNAVSKAEDAVICVDAAGEKSFRPASILTGAEREQIFSTEHSPYYGPLVGLANIARDCTQSWTGVDLDAYIVRPLKNHWTQMIRHLWDFPARSLEDDDLFRKECVLVPYIFDRIVEAERSFASIIEDDSDLTIPLMIRYWIHATGEEEIAQLSVFFVKLIPRRPPPEFSPGSMYTGPLVLVREGETDTTITILRRILQNSDSIAEFVDATASHLRRFNGPQVTNVAGILEKFWNWANDFRQDPLCSEFLRIIRTSVPLWSSLFEVSSRSTGNYGTSSFINTPHYYMSTLVVHLIWCRDSPSEAMALTELWVVTGVFDALEASLGEVLLHGTEDEKVELCSHLTYIYRGISYGPEGNPSWKSSIRQQLPRPRTIRRLWDISQQLSGRGIRKVAASHAARTVVMALEKAFTLPDTCKRRGCERKETARCTVCRSGYCGINCQKRDWKDHKMVCGLTMDIEPAVRDEAARLLQIQRPTGQR